jgi:hypothetical protein
MEGDDVAAGKTIAADLGAHLCFEDEAGLTQSPPKGRTWAPRGQRPVATVSGKRRGRVNIAGAVCYRPGHRARLYYRLHVYHARKNEPKTFSWSDYRDFIVAVHQQLGNLNMHLVQELYDFAEENKEWLRVFELPSYAPELNPAEGIWSLLRRSITNCLTTDLAGLEKLVRRKLKMIQYRPELMTGCLTETGLILEPP